MIPEVSFNDLNDEYAPSILCLKGTIQDKQVQILVDSGSMFNFVQAEVAQKLGLVHTNVDPFKVFVGNRDFIWCKVMSPQVEVVVQGMTFVVGLYHLDLAGADLVFGVARMQSLGRVLIDFEQLTIEFVLDGAHTTLLAEQLLQVKPLTSKSMKKLMGSRQVALVCQLQLVE